MPSSTASDKGGSAALVQEFDRIARMLRERELMVAAHPDDVTDELRQRIEQTPHATLHEEEFIPRGKLYVIRPGLLGV